MRTTIFFLIFIFISFAGISQSLIGAWESYHTTDSGERLRSVIIFADKYQVMTTYNAETGEFIKTNGGSWDLDGNMITEKVEFDSKNPDVVGLKTSFKIHINDPILEIPDSDISFKRLDDGNPGELQGAWLMSGRTIDGKTQTRDTDTPRKTMKILSGTRFQWIAYNTSTKQFMATGGGTYTTKDGKYTENLEFFSRDTSRVGMKLKFDYELLDADWHHFGLSSKGDPIDEIWSLRK